MTPQLIQQLEAAQPALRAACVSITGNRAEADDLVQETLMRALLKPPADLSKPLTPWLKRVARNLWIDNRRSHAAREARRPRLSAEAQQNAQTRVRLDSGCLLLTAMITLKPKPRAVLVLRALLEMTGAETAEALGLEPNHVKVLYHRAKRDLDASQPPSRAQIADWYEHLFGQDLQLLAEILAHALELDAHLPMNRLTATACLTLHTQAETLLEGTTDRAFTLMRWYQSLARERLLHHAQSIALLEEVQQLCEQSSFTELGDRLQFHLEYQRTLIHADYSQRGNYRLASAIQWRQGDLVQAKSSLYTALDHDPEPRRTRIHLGNLAFVMALRGEAAQALQLGEEALKQHRALGDKRSEGRTLNAIGMALQNAGDLDAASQKFNESLLLFKRLGDRRSVGKAYNNLGLIACERDELSRAATLFHRAHEHAVEERSRIIARANLGVLQRLRRPRLAVDILEQVSKQAREIALPQLLGFSLAHLAAARASLAPDSVDSLLSEAHEALVEVGADRILEVWVACDAAVAVAHASRTDDTPSDREQLLRRAEHALAELTQSSDGPPPAARFAAVRIATAYLTRQLAKEIARTPTG